MFKPRNPQKLAILFFHATGHDALFPNLEQIETLLTQGLTVFAFDLPGHGRGSSGTLHLDHIVATIKAVVSYIEEQGFKTCDLIFLGQSLGASLAVYAQSIINYPLKGIICLAMPLVAPSSLSFFKELLFMPWRLLAKERLRYQGIYYLIPPFLKFKRNLYPIRLESHSGHYVSFVFKLIDQINAEDLLAKTSVSTLLLYGQRDFIAPMPKDFSSLLPNIQVESMSGFNHYAMILSPMPIHRGFAWLDVLPK